MRKVALTLASALAVAAVAAPAQAVTVTFTPNTTALPDNGVVVENFSSYTPGNVGVNSKIETGAVPGEASDPAGNSGKFLSVLSGGSFVYSLPAQAPVVQLLIGTLDLYNSVTLTVKNLTTNTLTDQTFTGSALAGSSYFGGSVDGALTFDTGTANEVFTQLVLGSSGNSFEVARIATAAPEPATWGMMILGFGIAGTSLRSRRRQSKLATA